MNRRKFSRNVLLSGLAIPAVNMNMIPGTGDTGLPPEDIKKLPVREFDVVVAGGGTAGAVAAIASARQGAKTALIEAKGYPGGTVVEGELPSTAISTSGEHSPEWRNARS